MSNYSSLKATINANIKQNGNGEITGPILNSVLNAMVDSLAGYHYSGIATPATNPGTPDNNVFYIASEAGAYTNFGSLAVAEGEVAILKYNGTWTKEVTGAATAAEVSQLSQEVEGYEETIEDIVIQEVASGYLNLNSSTLPAQRQSSATTYSAMLAVAPGEKYRISGLHTSSTAARFWATGNAERARQEYALTKGEPARETIELVIAEGIAWLYVNLAEYDSETDGVWKITETHEQHDGLVQKVESQGERINGLAEDINGTITEEWQEQDLAADKFYNTNLNPMNVAPGNSTTGTYCCKIEVAEGDIIRITGMGGGSSSRLWATTDAERNIIRKAATNYDASDTIEITIEAGETFICINLANYDSANDSVARLVHVVTGGIRSELSALASETNKLKEFAQPLVRKKVMFFGDSLTQFVYNDKGIPIYFAEASGADVYKAAIGGSRFSQRGTPTTTPSSEAEARAALDICNMVKAWCEEDFTKQDAAVTYLDNYAARVQVLKDCPIGGTDIVMIGGGGNDFTSGVPFGDETSTSLSTINGAINQIVTMLLTANPALKIYIYSPVVGYKNGSRVDENWSDNFTYTHYGKTKPELIDLLAERVKAWHIPYIDLYWTLGWNQLNFSNYYISTDDAHPYKGFDVIARRLYHQVLAFME